MKRVFILIPFVCVCLWLVVAQTTADSHIPIHPLSDVYADQTFGPFTLPDANEAYRFDSSLTEPITHLRLDVVTSNGGNTGLVEWAVYAPANRLYLPLMEK